MGDKLLVGKVCFGPREDYDNLLSKTRHWANIIPKVFICIRLRPKSEDPIRAKREFENNLERAKIAARYAALNGYDPEATTIYFTQFLNDFNEVERDLGRKIVQSRLYACNEIWMITDKGEVPSSGMISDLTFAVENDIQMIGKDFAEIKKWVENYDKASH